MNGTPSFTVVQTTMSKKKGEGPEQWHSKTSKHKRVRFFSHVELILIHRPSYHFNSRHDMKSSDEWRNPTISFNSNAR